MLFNGIGDLTEDFIEQAHQYGIQDHLRSRNSKLNEKRAFLHVNWEQVHNHPAVQIKLKEVAQSSIRRKRKKDDNGIVQTTEVNQRVEKKNQLQEEKKFIRLDALQLMSTHDGPFLKSGLQRNIDDIRLSTIHITTVCRSFIARRKVQRIKRASIMLSTIYITTICRTFIAIRRQFRE